MRIGDKLRNLRLQRGWSQAQVAKGLNCRQTTVSSWEGGVNEPSLSTISEIADFFHVSPQSLLPFEFTPDDETQMLVETIMQNPRLKVLFDRASKMKDEDIDTVNTIVQAIYKEQNSND